ncbi:MAG: putative nucleic acid-binding Zn-ribbon protein [Myxococcota bacterium]
MNETIAALIELQTIDDEIRGYKVGRDELAGNLDRLGSILQRMNADLNDKREKLEEAERFYNDKRTDLQADSERMTHAKSKLAGVSRTKEYAAMQRELDNLRKKYGEDEAELTRLSQAIDDYKTSIASEEAKLEELQSEVSREESASSNRLTGLDTTIGSIASRKEAITVKLPRSLVTRYHKLLDQREGTAVVPAVAGRCQGCRMKIPPQTYIYIQRGEKLLTCASCQRYLYYSAEIAAAAVSQQ